MAAKTSAPVELKGKVVAITGCNRGIGLELAKQLLDRGNTVIAGVRNPAAAQELLKLQESHSQPLTILELDVADTDSIAAWAAAVAEAHKAVDVVFNNAGILEWTSIEDVTADAMMRAYQVNAMGPVFVVQALLKHKLLPPNSLVATLTSLVASITESEAGSGYAYRCSKTAANMAAKTMSIDLADRGITCTILHPGYVRTDMNKGKGYMDVDESVRGMIKVLESDVPLNGEWYHSTGRHLPW